MKCMIHEQFNWQDLFNFGPNFNLIKMVKIMKYISIKVLENGKGYKFNSK